MPLERDIKIIQLFSDGFTHAEIAEYLGSSVSLITKVHAQAKKDMVLEFRRTGDLMGLSRTYGLTPEVVAEYIRFGAMKFRDECIQDRDADYYDEHYNYGYLEWDRIIESVGGIAPPEKSRHVLRKEWIKTGNFGSSPTIKPDDVSLWKAKVQYHAACAKCDESHNIETMFRVNVGSIDNRWICQLCMEDAVNWLLARKSDDV